MFDYRRVLELCHLLNPHESAGDVFKNLNRDHHPIQLETTNTAGDLYYTQKTAQTHVERCWIEHVIYRKFLVCGWETLGSSLALHSIANLNTHSSKLLPLFTTA